MRQISLAAAMLLTAALSPAVAQDAVATDQAVLALELNALDASDTGCRVTFLATNKMGTALDGAGFEMALFGADGRIDRLLALDFGAMPEGKTRVLQFDIAGLVCTDVSRVLVNDVTDCESLDPAICLARLDATSRLDVEFGI